MRVRHRSWSELDRAERTAVTVGATLEIALTVWAALDLAQRPVGAVRGPRTLWASLLVVQPIGPVAYLVVGRRTAAVRDLRP